MSSVSIFFDSSSKINAIHLVFAKKLGFAIWSTNNGTLKIDGITFKTYKIVILTFLVIDQAKKVRILEEIFSIVNVSPNIVHEIFFLTLSDANVDFLKKDFW